MTSTTKAPYACVAHTPDSPVYLVSNSIKFGLYLFRELEGGSYRFSAVFWGTAPRNKHSFSRR